MLPVCNRRYHEQLFQDAGSPHDDTVINMDDGARGWQERVAAFTEHQRRAATMSSFSDYAIVMQAALLGQGVALDPTLRNDKAL